MSNCWKYHATAQHPRFDCRHVLVLFISELESEPLTAKTVGPSHSDEDEDSAPDQDDGELLRPAVTITEEFGIRQRPSTSKETAE